MALRSTHRLPVDRGWAWVILVTSFLCLLLICGALYSVSVFNIIFLEVFHESKAKTSWVGSLLIGLLAMMGPVSSALTERLGWRATVMLGGLIASLGTVASAFATSVNHLFITFGLIAGFGHGLAYTPAIVVVGYYFDKYRTVASGIASAGAGAGMFVFPSLIEYLITHYTWRDTMVYIGGAYLQLVVLGALLRPLDFSQIQKEILELERRVDPDDIYTPTPHDPAGSGDATSAPAEAVSRHISSADITTAAAAGNLSPLGSRVTINSTRTVRCMLFPRKRVFTFGALKESLKRLGQMKFLIFCWSIFTFGVGLSALYLHFSAFMLSKGAKEGESMFLVSIVGVSSIVSRIFTGIAGNDQSIDNIILYIGTFGVTGICTLMCPILALTYYGRILYAVCFGFYGSCFNVLLAPLTVELIGLQYLTTAFGIEMVVNGIAYLIGPPLAGLLYDKTGSFDASFYLAGVCLICSSAIMMLVSVFEKTQPKGETAYLYTMAAQEEMECEDDDFEVQDNVIEMDGDDDVRPMSEQPPSALENGDASLPKV